MEDFKGKVVRGSAAKVVAQIANFVLRIVALILFARLLEPSDFGIVGMVTVVTGFLMLFRDFGLSTAAVQRSELTDGESSALFWLNVLIGAILFVIMAAAAPVMATFYGDPRLQAVSVALGSAFVLNSLGVQHSALLQRAMRFETIAIIEIAALVVSTGIGLLMAKMGFGYWALVGWSLALPAVNSAGAWLATRWIPSRPARAAGLGPALRFGGTVTLNIVTVYVAYNLDKLLVGRLFGAAALGIYGRAYQLVSLPADGLLSSAGNVAFAALSRVKEDRSALRRYFLKGYTLIVALIVPIVVLFGVLGDPVVDVLLGPKWHPAGRLLQLFAPTLLVFALINPTGWLMYATGEVAKSFWIGLAILPVVVAGYTLGIPWGKEGIAAGFSIAMSLWVVPHLCWFAHGSPVSASDMFRAVAKPLLAGAVSAAATLAFDTWLPADAHVLVRLCAGSLVLGTTYAVVLLWALGEWSFYVGVARALLQRTAADAR